MLQGFLKNKVSKPFLKNGLFFIGIAFFTVCFFYPLKPVHASILSNIFDFFTGKEAHGGETVSPAAISMPLLGSSVNPVWPDDNGSFANADHTLSASQDNALVAPRNPIGIISDDVQDTIVVYLVQKGDVPSVIATKFGISLNTLLWANNIKNPNLIKEGDELIILPVSGVHYEVKKGDTLEAIAKKFKGDSAEIASFNGLAIDEMLEPGSAIIIPDGELTPAPSSPGTVPSSTVKSSRLAGLPDYRGYFMRPIFGGRKSRGIHGYNGIDLANSCGFPVMASAGGTVIIARNAGWNGGYGKYIVIAHPNGTQTLYAHLSMILGSTGQQVAQGSQIAKIGSTGNSTGCHVHFEIRGAKNPF